MGKIVLGIFCVVFLMAFSGPIGTGIHNWRVDSVTQQFSITTTDGTTGNVVLSRELFGNDLAQITALTSSYGSETPISGTYTSATKTLALTNLSTSQTRTITVTYYSEKNDDYMKIIGPFLLILIFGGILASIVYGLISLKKR